MTANTSPENAAEPPDVGEERPSARRSGTATSAPRRPGLLGGFAALDVTGGGAHTPAPTQAELRSFSDSRVRLTGAA